MSDFERCRVTGVEWRMAAHWPRGPVHFGDLCSFDISLHNQRCAGRMLDCLMYWAKDLFTRFEFSIGDTLYRHTYATIGHPDLGILSAAEAEAIAKAEGIDWQQAHEGRIAAVLGQNIRFRHWDEWRESIDFPGALARARRAITGESMTGRLRSDTERFLERRAPELCGDEQVIAALSEFIIEEAAVYFLHSKAEQVTHVYPGKTLVTLRGLSDTQPRAGDDVEFFRVFANMSRVNMDLRL